MCDAFEVVTLAMCEVIHWITVPFCTRTMVWSMYNSIHDRVTEVHVWIGHIELCTQNHTAFNGLCRVHLIEQSETFLNWAVTIWAWCAGGCRRSFL